ncbi:helix-turn-helix domain-containing protein [Nostoc sp.]|uniref:helix-turn-helix domain-containing protein n=1 Tax=Nostoc sp. TaxID=1180 RepID=UPI003FA5F59F
MTRMPLLVEDDFEYFTVPIQVNLFGNSPINHALTAVAQEVARLLQHANSVQADDSKHAGTIAIRAIEPEYSQILTVEPLTERELEVLQLIVDGQSNNGIAKNLYITTGTVKTHVRNILKKLCASDRTQAAIRALRSGLVH